MITLPVHISPKGQVVLPKAVRMALGTQNIVFEITETQILIKPVHSISGALANYQKNYSNFSEVREQAWVEVSSDR